MAREKKNGRLIAPPNGVAVRMYRQGWEIASCWPSVLRRKPVTILGMYSSTGRSRPPGQRSPNDWPRSLTSVAGNGWPPPCGCRHA